MKSQRHPLREEIKAALKDIGVATKDDFKQFATKDDLKAMEERQDKKYATKDDLKPLATKEELKPLATKAELKLLATKADLLKTERSLKRRMGVERNKIIGMIGKLATSTPSSKAFNELKAKVERRGLN